MDVGASASSRAVTLALAACAATGCIPQVVVRDRESACQVARSALRGSLSPGDLVALSQPFPVAHKYARRAWDSRIAIYVLTGIGAAGLAGAFVTGFAVDTSQPAARTALYSVVAGTIGAGAGVLIAAAVASRARIRAVTELDAATREECP